MWVVVAILGVVLALVILGYVLHKKERARRHPGVLWQILVPEQDESTLMQMTAFLEELYRGCSGNSLHRQHFALEYYADVNGTAMYLWLPEKFLLDKDLPTLISGFYPNAVVAPVAPENDPVAKEGLFGMEFTLQQEYTAPLATWDELAGDGVAYLSNHLAVYQPGQFVGMQLVCEPNKKWIETMNRFIMEYEQALHGKEPQAAGGDSLGELIRGAWSGPTKPQQRMAAKPRSPLEEANLKRWKKLLTDPGGGFGFTTEIRIYTNVQENLAKYAGLLNFFSGGNALKAKPLKEVDAIARRWMTSSDYKHHLLAATTIAGIWHPPNEDTVKFGAANLIFSKFRPTPLPVGAFVLDFEPEYKAQPWLDILLAKAMAKIGDTDNPQQEDEGDYG
mgnify:CR=1 FL=1